MAVELGAHVNYVGPDGDTPLFHAYKVPQCVSTLVKAGAKVDHFDKAGFHSGWHFWNY